MLSLPGITQSVFLVPAPKLNAEYPERLVSLFIYSALRTSALGRQLYAGRDTPALRVNDYWVTPRVLYVSRARQTKG